MACRQVLARSKRRRSRRRRRPPALPLRGAVEVQGAAQRRRNRQNAPLCQVARGVGKEAQGAAHRCAVTVTTPRGAAPCPERTNTVVCGNVPRSHRYLRHLCYIGQQCALVCRNVPRSHRDGGAFDRVLITALAVVFVRSGVRARNSAVVFVPPRALCVHRALSYTHRYSYIYMCTSTRPHCRDCAAAAPPPLPAPPLRCHARRAPCPCCRPLGWGPQKQKTETKTRAQRRGEG